METQTSSVEITGKVLNFLANNRPEFIKEAWTGTEKEWIINHLEDKLSGYVLRDGKGYRTFEAMVRFMIELDSTNLEILTNYIEKTHKPL